MTKDKDYIPVLLTDKLQIIEQKQFNNSKIIIIGNIELDRFFEIGEDKKEIIKIIISLINGENTLEQIQKILLNEYRIKTDISFFLKKLSSIGLIKGEEATVSINEIDAVGIKILNLKFKGMNEIVRAFLSFLFRTGRLFYLLFVIFLIPIIIIFWDNINDKNVIDMIIKKRSIVAVGLTYYLISWFVLFVHELAHICAIAFCGLRLKQVSISLYMGLYPLYYSKAQGIYTLCAQKRLIIISAGLAANMTMAIIALLVIIFSPQSSFCFYLATLFLIKNIFMIISNISPFKLSDGYFIFSTILGIKNLRSNIFSEGIKGIFRTFKRDRKLALLKFAYYVVFLVIVSLSIVYFSIFVYGIIKEASEKLSILPTVIVIALVSVYVIFAVLNLYKKIKFWRRNSNEHNKDF